MPIIVIVVITVVMFWLVFVNRRARDPIARSRAAHPSSPPQSSVHIVHLGRD